MVAQTVRMYNAFIIYRSEPSQELPESTLMSWLLILPKWKPTAKLHGIIFVSLLSMMDQLIWSWSKLIYRFKSLLKRSLPMTGEDGTNLNSSFSQNVRIPSWLCWAHHCIRNSTSSCDEPVSLVTTLQTQSAMMDPSKFMIEILFQVSQVFTMARRPSSPSYHN